MTSLEQNANAPGLGKAHVDKFETAYKGDTESPLFNVISCASPAGLPPTLLQVAGLDPIRDDGLVWADELEKAGVPTRLKVYDGVPHSFWSIFPEWSLSKQFVADTMAGLGWLLGKESK
jgi:acetyl esterase/lipase